MEYKIYAVYNVPYKVDTTSERDCLMSKNSISQADYEYPLDLLNFCSFIVER